METTELLSGVRQALDDAVTDLVAPRSGSIRVEMPGGWTERRRVYRDSVYAEMVAALPGGQGTFRGSTAGPILPLGVDALDWLNDVHATSAWWAQTYVQQPLVSVMEQLTAVNNLGWRPQDVPLVQHIEGTIRRWVRKATLLIDGAEYRQMEVCAPCPQCGVRIIHRQDGTGEIVRSAALLLTTQGCYCQACQEWWPQNLLEHLAQLLDVVPAVLLRVAQDGV